MIKIDYYFLCSILELCIRLALIVLKVKKQFQ